PDLAAASPRPVLRAFETQHDPRGPQLPARAWAGGSAGGLVHSLVVLVVAAAGRDEQRMRANRPQARAGTGLEQRDQFRPVRGRVAGAVVIAPRDVPACDAEDVAGRLELTAAHGGVRAASGGRAGGGARDGKHVHRDAGAAQPGEGAAATEGLVI